MLLTGWERDALAEAEPTQVEAELEQERQRSDRLIAQLRAAGLEPQS